MLKKIICFFLLTGCANTLERLQNIGQNPILHEVPIYKEDKKEPLNIYQEDNQVNNNSLWVPGKRLFLKDNQANKIGDIIKVNIKVSDNAKLENESKRSRKTSENLPMPNIPIVSKALSHISNNDKNLLDIKGGNNNLGSGSINRNEKINTQVAASIIEILPNGNLIIKGTQEIRVNFEVRQIYIAGIVKAGDISVDNTVDSSKVADLRLSYGGKGHISEVQQPRLGTQLIDILSPF